MYSYLTRMYSWVTRKYPYVTRMHSCVTRKYPYVTRMHPFVTRKCLVCIRGLLDVNRSARVLEIVHGPPIVHVFHRYKRCRRKNF